MTTHTPDDDARDEAVSRAGDSGDAGSRADDAAPRADAVEIGGFAPGGGFSRRAFLGGAAALAAGLALPGLAGAAGADGAAPAPDLSAAAAAAASGRRRTRPNIILLTTDQERYPQHWPEGWAEQHLPNRRRLARHGLTFRRAFCSAAMCSPSRASLYTGLYPAEHGVTEVLQYGDKPDEASQGTLHPRTQNLAKLARKAGYDVQYRGKWHMSKDPSGTLAVQSRRDLERYGFKGWLTPDAGADQSSQLFGGGTAHYDALTARQAADFLRAVDPRSPQPFFLVVSLVNPHDLMGCPKTWFDPSYSDLKPYKGKANYHDVYPRCVDQGIGLPPTWDEPVANNLKPSCQWQSTAMWSVGLDPVLSPERMAEYVNFYAYLHKRSDEDMGVVLDALEADRRLWEDTIVIRLSDHGEMGLAHGGMREKAYNAYEETLHVPLVVSNPKLFPRGAHTDALASLVDIMPTLATMTGAGRPRGWKFRGRDLTPVIRDAVEHPRRPRARVQDSVVFTTDETIGSRPGWVFKEGMVKQPAHIRCIREERYKFAMYFDPAGPAVEYELYDLEDDPLELHNRGVAGTPDFDAARFAELRQKLDRRMRETHTTPA